MSKTTPAPQLTYKKKPVLGFDLVPVFCCVGFFFLFKCLCSSSYQKIPESLLLLHKYCIQGEEGDTFLGLTIMETT